ncbi:MAG: TrgA family protein [Yoonia sp.]|uniref:TrgA family protein n=1 Tax=Yoonia sp. TaxID=2212373 RepID=UPI00273DE30F|nr:TrgA family protein [Yoonia sp.]MDP5084306.1 TrgA family protein [Yoonia sp.]MDP5360984.1 TrgA family protein [Paracoccaceae bacterium]
MPTAGRLAGAVIFGLFGWYMAGISIPFFPEGVAPRYWIPAAAAISLFIGWKVCGSRAGRGYNPAVAVGLTAAFMMGFSLVFVLAFNQMIKNAMRLRYDGPMEAVVDTFSQMVKFASYFNDIPLIATLLIGGILCAWFTEYFGKRYP